jgi:hypothetical protein
VQHAHSSPQELFLGWRDILRELALVGAAALCYFGVRNLTVGSAATAFANADRLQSLERKLSLGHENLLVGRTVFVTLFNWVYIWGHWPVIIAVGVYLFRSHRQDYRLLRNAMFISGFIGFAFFAFFPVAPPRLVDPHLIDTVTLHSDAYRALQPPGLTNQYAAFPSLHFGWNLLVGVILWGASTNRLLRLFAVVGPSAMAIAVVATANHFLIDLAGGALVAGLGWWVARRLHEGRAGYTRTHGVRHSAPRRQRPHAAA